MSKKITESDLNKFADLYCCYYYDEGGRGGYICKEYKEYGIKIDGNVAKWVNAIDIETKKLMHNPRNLVKLLKGKYGQSIDYLKSKLKHEGYI